MDEIKSKDCLVCFLDILGYKELMKKNESFESIYDSLKYTISFHNGELKKMALPSEIKDVADAMHVQVVSDSVLFILNLEKYHTTQSSKNHEFLCIRQFLSSVAAFWGDFSKKTNVFCRGGIARGGYYQYNIYNEKNQFIFGSAVSVASELQEKADVPRILIDEELFDYIKSLDGAKDVGKIIPEGADGYYLDIYHFYGESHKQHLKEDLKKLANGIKYQIRENKKERKILNKYCWLQHYHNLKVQQLGMDKEEGCVLTDFTFII